MKLNEIKEVGFYREENDSDRKIIFEIYKNGDREWLEKDPNATLLLDTWIYEYKDENDRKRYFANGDLSAVYLDETSIDVIKIEDTNYKVFGEYGHLLIEDKPTYKEQLENSEARIKELKEKLTVEEMKNFDLREEIKELKDLNRRLDNQREEYWKGYLKLDKKLKIAEEVLQYYANSKMPDDLYTSGKINGSAISTDNWAIRGEFNQCKYKVYYDNENAKQALQKMKEIEV